MCAWSSGTRFFRTARRSRQLGERDHRSFPRCESRPPRRDGSRKSRSIRRGGQWRERRTSACRVFHGGNFRRRARVTAATSTRALESVSTDGPRSLARLLRLRGRGVRRFDLPFDSQSYPRDVNTGDPTTAVIFTEVAMRIGDLHVDTLRADKDELRRRSMLPMLRRR